MQFFPGCGLIGRPFGGSTNIKRSAVLCVEPSVIPGLVPPSSSQFLLFISFHLPSHSSISVSSFFLPISHFSIFFPPPFPSTSLVTLIFDCKCRRLSKFASNQLLTSLSPNYKGCILFLNARLSFSSI